RRIQGTNLETELTNIRANPRETIEHLLGQERELLSPDGGGNPDDERSVAHRSRLRPLRNARAHRGPPLVGRNGRARGTCGHLLSVREDVAQRHGTIALLALSAPPASLVRPHFYQCRRRESNPHAPYGATDFESAASACSATSARACLE